MHLSILGPWKHAGFMYAFYIPQQLLFDLLSRSYSMMQEMMDAEHRHDARCGQFYCHCHESMKGIAMIIMILCVDHYWSLRCDQMRNRVMFNLASCRFLQAPQTLASDVTQSGRQAAA